MHTISFSRTMLALRALSYPAVIIALSLLPHNPHETFSVYSDYGAFAWTLIFFCWPWLAYVVLKYVLHHRSAGIKHNLLFGLQLMLFYSLVTIFVSTQASQGLTSAWGHPLSGSTFWWALNFPMSFFLFLIR